MEVAPPKQKDPRFAYVIANHDQPLKADHQLLNKD
jgi:hypothetical protein